MRLPRELMHAPRMPDAAELRFDMRPIQLGLCGSPWHVAVASALCCRVRCDPQVIRGILVTWPTPELMEGTDVLLEHLVRPLGLHRTRARHIQALSRRWNTSTWRDLRDLPGVGEYVADAVQLCCFGAAMDGCDGVLQEYADARPGPRMCEGGGRWYVDDAEFDNPLEAYGAYRKARWSLSPV